MTQNSKARILVIEDEEDIRDLVHFNLLKEGHQVECASDGQLGLLLAKKNRPTLIILDLMLPKMDGMEVCRLLRLDQATKSIPVLMVTAKSTDEDIVAGLRQGADDYLPKPFSPKVLIARVDAVLRRLAAASSVGDADLLNIHDIEIDPIKRRVRIGADKTELDLTYSEFEILHLMALKPGWVFNRSQIVDSIRGENHAITDRSVDVQIVGLRRKMGEFGQLIETVRGAGYRFKD